MANDELQKIETQSKAAASLTIRQACDLTLQTLLSPTCALSHDILRA
jgi:hypothetical protein